ncbi:MAG: FAD binding domain-containing protein [Acidimicrobiales bacterium]
MPAASIDEAIAALVEYGYDAKILAGGQSLIPMLKLRLAAPRVLIDLSRLSSLSFIDAGDDHITIGALTPESALEESPLLRERLPILVDTSSVIADPLVRNLATVGGNVAHGDPANDHPATMVALGATFTVHGPDNTREIGAEEFFVDLFTTSLRDDEILTDIRVPVSRPGTGAAYVKYERQVGDYAIAGAAVFVETKDERITNARIALTNLGSTPVRAQEAERLLASAPWSETLSVDAGNAATAAVTPWSDMRGSANYRRRVAAHVTTQAVHTAFARAGEAR